MRTQTPYMFFKQHAGYSYDPKTETQEQGRRRCARALARAERLAKDIGLTCEFEYDTLGCIGCDCDSEDCACSTGAEHEVLCAVVRDDCGNSLASLGSICGATREYRRVVSAELFSEALDVLMKGGN